MKTTIDQDLAKFAPQIEELAAFAKSINFDIKNGDVKELARQWVVERIRFYNNPTPQEIFLIKGLL